jgi:hypothetical protein
VKWHLGRRVPPTVVVSPPPVYVSPSPPPVWIAPAPPSPPPPPVYVAPPPQQPIYVHPQPVYVPAPMPAAPVAAAPAPVPAPVVVRAMPPRPQWEKRFGLGATYQGQFALRDGAYQGWGVLGQLRYRAARHLYLELMSGYERSVDKSDFVRTDVPVAFGLMIPILGPEYALSPYFVGAVGMNFASLRLIDAETKKLDDRRTQALAQAGGGLELRLGRRFAINADVRLEGRWNLREPSEAVLNTTSINGKPVQPIENSVGLRAAVGGTLYF